MNNIEPTTVYETFAFFPDEVGWEINGNLSGDLVAGMLVGIRAIYIVINYLDNLNISDFSVQIIPVGEIDEAGPIQPNNIVQISNGYSEDDEYDKAVESYYAGEINGIDDMDEFLHDMQNIDNTALDKGLYYWLIYSRPDTHQLFSFQSIEFVQGFISICRAFRVDFTDYAFGNPFMYHENTKTPTYYSIEL